jgi:hypothetical protein
MPGITTTRYVIRTTTGNKGPFSPAEIGRLVEDGRLAPTTRILDVDSKRAITAAEALTAASTEATRPIDFDVIRKAALAAQRGTADISDLNIPASISSQETETVRRPEMAKRVESLRKKTTEDGLEATEAQPLGESGYAPAALVRHGAEPTPLRTPFQSANPRQPPAAPTPPAPQPQAGTGSAPRSGTTAKRGRGIDTGPTRATLRRTGSRRKAKSSAARVIVILVAVGAILCTAVVAVMTFAHRDAYLSQGADLLAFALKHPELVDATEGERGLTCILIKRDHQAALEEARSKRGFFEGYKPAYDQDRYLAAQKQAIVKLLASSDSAALAGLSRELTSLTDPALSDLATAKRLAQEAVNLDHEKGWRSLDALAWALYRGGDAAHAAMVEDQAAEMATDAATKAQCASQASVFKSSR